MLHRVNAMQVVWCVGRIHCVKKLLEERVIRWFIQRFCVEANHDRIAKEMPKSGIIFACFVDDRYTNRKIGVVATLVRLEDHMSSIPSEDLQATTQIALARKATVHNQWIVVSDKRKCWSVESENDHMLTVLKQVVEVVALTTVKQKR